MENCIFCKIIKGEIPSYKIYEDNNTYAFLDISNDIVGHTLVVPKNHVKNILYSDKETLNNIMNAVKIITDHYINNCGFEGFHLLSNNEPSAEQSVMHMHFHIIPRINNDNIKFYPTLKSQDINLKDLSEKLKI